MEIAAVRYEDAHLLTDALEAELTARYGDGGASPVDGTDFLAPHGIFLVVEIDGVEVACGGLRVHQDGIGEVKRMYTAPAARGKGVARLLLRALVGHAGSAGLREVWLETGTLQPEAIRLYESEGFTPIPPYGHHKGEPLSRCFAVRLA